MIFAQVPGIDTAVNTAASHGWEAVVIVIVIASAISAITVVGVMGWKRENRMAARVTDLEGKYEGLLVDLVEKTAKRVEASERTEQQVIAEFQANRESNAELMRVIESWRKNSDESGDKLQGCISQMGDNCTARMRELLPEAMRAALTDEQIVRHFVRIAEAAAHRDKTSPQPEGA